MAELDDPIRGSGSRSSATRAPTSSSLRRSRATSSKPSSPLPITLIILVLAFGALVAALVPLLLAATAVFSAIGLLGPLSQIWPVDESASSVIR